jgi:heme A synthase
MMNPVLTGTLVFASLASAVLLGMRVRAALPDGHRSQETKDAVKVGMGFVSTMAALVLGLLVASTKGAYEYQEE